MPTRFVIGTKCDGREKRGRNSEFVDLLWTIRYRETVKANHIRRIPFRHKDSFLFRLAYSTSASNSFRNFLIISAVKWSVGDETTDAVHHVNVKLNEEKCTKQMSEEMNHTQMWLHWSFIIHQHIRNINFQARSALKPTHLWTNSHTTIGWQQ